jgi:D-lactate dehydrogenase
MRIAIFEVMPGEREALSTHLPAGHDIEYFEEPLTPDSVAHARDADIVSVFVKSELTRSVLDQLPQLKLIATRSMGYDHIDVEHARAKNIRVANVTTYAAHPVAEFAFALLLAVMRRVYPAAHQLREGNVFDIRNLGGFNLYDKTMGVMGTGRIGRQVATIARGFGMHVIAYDPHPDVHLAATTGFAYVDPDELYAKSDVISLHMPSTPETHHFVSDAAFGRMRKGVVIINTARGEVLDTHALVTALKNGTVWGAGLDVLEEERAFKEETDLLIRDKEGVNYEVLTANHILVDMPNVLVTPHIAFQTAEAMHEIIRVTSQTIATFIAGKEQPYL